VNYETILCVGKKVQQLIK